MVLQPILDEHFAYLADQPTFLEVCSWNKFRMFASGRTSCNTLSIRFNMVKRQCPWHEWILSHLFKSEDVVTMELWLPKMVSDIIRTIYGISSEQYCLRNHPKNDQQRIRRDAWRNCSHNACIQQPKSPEHAQSIHQLEREMCHKLRIVCYRKVPRLLSTTHRTLHCGCSSGDEWLSQVQ